MRFVLVGDVPEQYSEVLRRLGFEISREVPRGGDAFVMFLENCELAQRLGFGCFTREELEEFLRYVQAN
ncbi:hypothetical protein PYWP30_01084 [Pyrobaculum sp. WP30]|nr:hypothetical protein PYWP30_01084 [Pyrobaculum sp. WP30]